MRKLLAIRLSSLSLAAVIAVAGCSDERLQGSTPTAFGTSACRGYLHQMRDSAEIDAGLQAAGWVESSKKGKVPWFSRAFEKNGVTVAFTIRDKDAFGKSLSKPLVTCTVSSSVDSEEIAKAAAASANEILSLREVSPFRFATEGNNPNRAVIGYGPSSNGKTLVLVEMYNGPP